MCLCLLPQKQQVEEYLYQATIFTEQQMQAGGKKKVTCKEIREDSSSRSAMFVMVIREEVRDGALLQTFEDATRVTKVQNAQNLARQASSYSLKVIQMEQQFKFGYLRSFNFSVYSKNTLWKVTMCKLQLPSSSLSCGRIQSNEGHLLFKLRLLRYSCAQRSQAL